jgi:TrmH family RNA methyltransferase
MLSKNVVKDIQSLALKKHRDESGLFLAEGPKLVEELLDLIPGQIEQVYATASWGDGKNGVTVIDDHDIEKISALNTPNQVVAVVRKMAVKLPGADGITVYLDRIQDPGNLGTIIRIADWFGVNDIVCSTGCADIYNPKTVQSTMASIARVNIYNDSANNWLQSQSVPIYAASLQGENLYTAPKAEKGILLIGNESKGIRPEFLARATRLITIPRRGGAESLNAAVATGIILSHLLPNGNG